MIAPNIRALEFGHASMSSYTVTSSVYNAPTTSLENVMKLARVRYDLIGTHPEVADVNLENVIAEYEAAREDQQHLLATTIVKAAEHFYGVTLEQNMTMLELIDIIEAREQELAA
jgi:hypothetical protein